MCIIKYSVKYDGPSVYVIKLIINLHIFITPPAINK